MPSRIVLANGKHIDVAEDANNVHGRLNENGGLPVRFDVPDGDETKIVYVNPQQVAYFEDVKPSVYEKRRIISG